MPSSNPSTPSAPTPVITRTYRTAIRLGEDFVTLEETVTLPVTATDAEIAQAVDLGWRIYQAQRRSIDEQVGEIRAGQPAQPVTFRLRDPEAAASDKQRTYIARLQADLGWDDDQIAVYAEAQGVDLHTMTKGTASAFIDGLKRLLDQQRADDAGAPLPATPARQQPRAPAQSGVARSALTVEPPAEDLPF